MLEASLVARSFRSPKEPMSGQRTLSSSTFGGRDCHGPDRISQDAPGILPFYLLSIGSCWCYKARKMDHL